MSKLKIIQSLIQELEFRGGRKENIERAEALKDMLSEAQSQKSRICELETALIDEDYKSKQKIEKLKDKLKNEKEEIKKQTNTIPKYENSITRILGDIMSGYISSLLKELEE